MRCRKFPPSIYIAMIIVLGLISWVASSFIRSHIVIVSGTSMYPTFNDGDVLYVTPVHSERDIPRGNPVCWVQLDSGRNVIKRLIGYPGDTVELLNGDTYVNGVCIMERTTESYDNVIFNLGDDDYLFLGDNRADSRDGRNWSEYCKVDNILGVVRNSCLQ